jgi:hypothetical protein
LVVLTILKNISQWEGLSHILWKIKNVWNHQSVGKRSFTHQSRTNHGVVRATGWLLSGWRRKVAACRVDPNCLT